MLRNRRSLARTLLGAGIALHGSSLLPRRAAAQLAPPVPVPPGTTPVPTAIAPTIDVRSQLRLAAARATPGGRTSIERSLARLDDLAIDFSAGRLILVNIAAAELTAFDAGREVLRSRVVVGASRTSTPQMTTFVTSARCNPPWYVPASIVPELRAARATGFQTINGRMVQPPGPTNPLGPVRIGLLDSDGIFLHGTNAPGAFSAAGRAISHGCVRVERVIDLAAWVTERTPAAIRTTLATGRTVEILPAQEVQVVLAYLTAWPDASGRVAFHRDPYGADAAGARRLPIRRIARPVPQPPEEAEAAAKMDTPEDNPL